MFVFLVRKSTAQLLLTPLLDRRSGHVAVVDEGGNCMYVYGKCGVI